MTKTACPSPRAPLVALVLLTIGAMVGGWPVTEVEAHEVDLIEHTMGATNIHAIAGAGGLTIGVSRDGDLTVLTWPSPSYTDQVNYLTSNNEEARSEPRFGASAGMGAFAGIVYSTDGGDTVATSWLRGDDWTSEICYFDLRSSVITTTYTSTSLDLTVVQTDFVDEEYDVWVRRLDVTRAADSSVTDAWALFYANLAPTLSRLPEVPLADWAAEPRNDFAAVYDEATSTIVHFHPEDTGVISRIGDMLMLLPKEYGPIGVALAEAGPVPMATASALAAALDADYAPGVYMTLGSLPAADGWQVGFDETEICEPLEVLADNLATLGDRFPGFDVGAAAGFADLLRCPSEAHPGAAIREQQEWLATAQDALSDAADGELSGSPLAAGHVNEALRVPLTFVSGADGDSADATFYLAAGSTAAASRAALETVQTMPSDVLALRTAAAHSDWLAPLALPDAPGIDPLIVDFAARTLLNIRVGTDRETSAIVASISRQPSYGEDWPRDGAFFNAALDIAGLHDLVTERQRFYASLQRTEEAEPDVLIDAPGPGFPDDPDNHNYPADSWEMNYYADGMVGGNIRWEIDNTGLLVWSFVAHAGYIEDETDRLAYLEELYPNIRRAADLLEYWRDETNFLPWLANEDDNVAFTQGLHGTGITFGALRSAAMAARALGHDDDAERWEYRAAELRWAINTHLYDEDEGFIEGFTGNPGSAFPGASAWLAWPARAFGADDPRMLAQLEQNLDYLLALFEPDSQGGAYLTKTSVAAALIHPDEEQRERALEIATTMITEIADPDTLFLGEVFAAVDDDGDGTYDRFDNRVSTPHLWAATLVYLTVMAYYHPEMFDPHEALLPAAEIPDEVEPPEPVEDAGPDGGPDAGPDGGLDAGSDGGEDAGATRTASGGSCDCTASGQQHRVSWVRLLGL